MKPLLLSTFLSLGLGATFVANGSEIDNKIRKNADFQAGNYQLMLVGGGLSTCSSLASGNCLDADFDDTTRQQSHYLIDEKNIDAILTSQAFSSLTGDKREKVKNLFMGIYAEYQNEHLTRDELKRAFSNADAGGFDGSAFYNSMSDELYYTVLDHLEAPDHLPSGERRQEQVDLSQNKNRYAKYIYEQFVAMAAARVDDSSQSKPKIAVITASSRDPFESADFYQSAFEQAGAEVIWLPLDQSYQQAREWQDKGFDGCGRLTEIRADNGSFNREAIYPDRTALQLEMCSKPELMWKQLEQIQGVFFNGGDQSLTRKALRRSDGSDSPELKLIKQRFAEGQLVVGGTSAGTAIQPGGQFNQRPLPMISNGDSDTAFERGAFAVYPPSQRCQPETPCDSGLLASDLTYEADGGSGLFNLGTLDTHFSERDREARLALLAAFTGTRFAFGVDEATALVVGNQTAQQTPMAVIGQGGVWMVDTQSGIYKLQNNKRQLVAMSHYLNHGDTLSYDHQEQALSFSLKGEPLQQIKATTPPVEDGQWRQQLFGHCGSKEPIRWSQDGIAFVAAPSEDTRYFRLEDDELARCSYINLSFGMEN
ncbi:Cyanophycinase [Saliniradius amylolyticus]|uniref:Cyanophycinase n=1 Tax=Saliniradius amylolyticus TaxID=2183582 RepID=A0A2S2E5K2_9ALTE|nr:cyanophycinase [Saliniradius amylolyticus]AWL12247.1 Cyanophycinase [Saliniradius amylolyticus]